MLIKKADDSFIYSYEFLIKIIQEDDLIVELVGKQGNKKWSEIAKQLPGRIGKQCRER